MFIVPVLVGARMRRDSGSWLFVFGVGLFLFSYWSVGVAGLVVWFLRWPFLDFILGCLRCRFVCLPVALAFP
jgi:hypothetical protein